MFFQLPETEPLTTTKSPGALKSARRRRKKNALKNKIKKQAAKKAKQRFQTTMSSWAENFTMAATWQLKHNLAHWKSKARALEYENKILKDLLRHYYVNGSTSGLNEAMSVKSDSEENESSDDDEEEEDDVVFSEETEDNVELSEEFVEFLKGNTEFRKMREERTRLRKLEEEMPMMILEAGPQGPPEDSKEQLMKMYGEHWQKVAALQSSVQSQFMVDCDKYKPVFWPNIPLKI